MEELLDVYILKFDRVRLRLIIPFTDLRKTVFMHIYMKRAVTN